MKILLISSSYDSLTQRTHVELMELGHEVSIELAINDNVIREGVLLYQPDLILCPNLRTIIPQDTWNEVPCIIVHPGIKGDRGPASLDWAIYEEHQYFGVSAIQAAEEVDSGPIWATAEFSLRKNSKSSIFRDDMSIAAMQVIHLVVKRFENGIYEPEPLDYSRDDVCGRYRPMMPLSVRNIDWHFDSADLIMRKIRCSDNHPGVLDTIHGAQFYIYGVHREGSLIGPPGNILAKRHGAICRATVDGAVWITHLRKKTDKNGQYLKLPATHVLEAQLDDVSESPIALLYTSAVETYKEIWFREANGVAYLYFEFYSGAMSTEQCLRLTAAFKAVCARVEDKVIVLMGGRDFWSNGIHLNMIEASADAAQESWENVNALNDFVLEVLKCTDKYVISAMHGSAGAGGVMMALAADQVIAREGIILNAHYQSMGGLYGSEYWTYLLPRRVGNEMAAQLIKRCLPISAEKGKRIGLLDDVIYHDVHNPSSFHDQIVRIAEKKATDLHLPTYLAIKADELRATEQSDPLHVYREAELAKVRENVSNPNSQFHQNRKAFVYRDVPQQTPGYLAVHRKSNN